MTIITRPDILYLQEATPTNMIWGFGPKAEEQPQVYIDQMMSTLFTQPEASFKHPEIKQDLELDVLVEKAFNPRYCRKFVTKALAAAPTTQEVIIDRQRTLETLCQNTEVKEKVSNIAQLLNGLIKTLIRIDQCKQVRNVYSAGLLAAEVPLLSHYVDVIDSLSQLPESSYVLRKIREFGREIEATDNFQEVKRYSHAFRNRYTFTLEVAVDAIGAISKMNILKINESGRFTKRGFTTNMGGRFLLRALEVDKHNVVARMVDGIVNKNLGQISEMSFLLGPLDFYLSALNFYDQMASKGLELALPEIVAKEERAIFVAKAKNPLLLYKKGDKVEHGRDIVSNDVSYDKQNRMRIISGPNSGGKTVFIKTAGIVEVLAHSGMRVPAQLEGQPCRVSVIDELYTVFVSRESTTADTGGQLEYQAQKIYRVLRRATPYSLLLFDEIGKGTSEKDGAAFCFDNIVHPFMLSSEGPIGSAVYFSTHLHQFAKQVDTVDGVENYQAEIVQVTPTYRIIPGRAEKSYAKLVEVKVGLGKNNVDNLIRERREKGTL